MLSDWPAFKGLLNQSEKWTQSSRGETGSRREQCKLRSSCSEQHRTGWDEFLLWDKVQTCQQCHCNAKQSSGSLLHWKQTDQQAQCALFHNLQYLPPPGINSTSGIKCYFMVTTELHESTEMLHLSFDAQRCFGDTCYPVSVWSALAPILGSPEAV